MKKLFAMILMSFLMIQLFGCAKCISTEYQSVEVTIVDEYHRGSYVVPMKVGKVMTSRVVSAVYKITVEYDDKEYVISGKDTYTKYKNMVGQTVNATLEIRTYDNNSVRYDIIELN